MRPEQNLNQAFGLRQEQPHERLTPQTFVLRRVTANGCTLTPNERLCALVIAGRMNRRDTCWPSVDTIALDMGVSRKTAQRAVAVCCEGAAPLFARKWQRGKATPTYTLVRNPAAFAASRDQARARKATQEQWANLRARFGRRTDRAQDGNVAQLAAQFVRSMSERKVTAHPASERKAAVCERCQRPAVLYPDGSLRDYADEQQPHACPR